MSIASGGATPIRSPEQVKAELEGKPETAEQEVERLEDPRLARNYTFTLNYTDRRGKRWTGSFTNQILDMVQISRVGSISASMLGGAPAISADPYTLNHNEKLSHLTVSLVERPDWAKGEKLGQLFDKDLLDAIYVEVARHEAIFQGREAPEKDGAGEGEDAPGSPAQMVDK